MAEREFHGTIRNDWSSPLTWVADHLDGGDWQDPWYPSRAAIIQTGIEREWRAESDWRPLTGTAGWAMWSTTIQATSSADPNNHTEFIKLGWSVPFLGAPQFTATVTRFDPRTTGGSTFVDTSRSTLDVDVSFVSQTGNQPLFAEFVSTGLVFLFPPAWFMNIQFVTHPLISFRVRQRSQSQPLVVRRPPVIKLDSLDKLTWLVPSLSCGTAASLLNQLQGPGLAHLIEGRASCLVSNGGGERLNITSVTRISEDPAAMFPTAASVRDLGAGSGAYEIFITCTPNTFYGSAPYPVEYKIESDGGSLTVSFGALPRVDDTLADDLRRRAFTVINACNVPPIKWYQEGLGIDLGWYLHGNRPDPTVNQRLWMVQVSGLAVNSVIQIGRETGKSVGKALAGQLGMAHFLMASPTTEDKIVVTLEERGGPLTNPDALCLSTTQVELSKTAEINFSQPVSAVTGGESRAKAFALGIGGKLLEAIDLDLGETAWRLPFGGLRGCHARRGSLWVWGEEGLQLVSFKGDVVEHVHQDPITDVAFTGDLAWLQGSSDLIFVYDTRALKMVGELPIPNLQSIAGVGKALLAQGKSGLQVATFNYETKQVALSNGKLEKNGHIRALRSESPFILVDDNGGSDLVDFYHLDSPRRVAEYAETPWFMSSRQVGRYLLTHNDREQSASVSFIGKTVATL